MDKWYVEKTPCYPAEWKVRTKRNDDNATLNYFRDLLKAQEEAAKRNAREATKNGN